MKGRAIEWLPEELAWIEANRTLPQKVRHARFCSIFQRSDVTAAHVNSLCKRKGWLTGRDGRFQKGQKPMNQEHLPKLIAAGAASRFKKGNLPHNTKHLGHERLSKDGYVEVSVDEVNPHTGFGRRYVQKHRWLWEKVNGPVPDGHRLKCLDGNKLNTDPSNWEALPLALAPRLNGRFGRGYDEAPAELKPTIMAIAKLEHRAREARRGSKG